MSHQGIKVLLLSVCVSYNIPEMEGGAAPKCDDDNPTVTIVHKYVAYQINTGGTDNGAGPVIKNSNAVEEDRNRDILFILDRPSECRI